MSVQVTVVTVTESLDDSSAPSVTVQSLEFEDLDGWGEWITSANKSQGYLTGPVPMLPEEDMVLRPGRI